MVTVSLHSRRPGNLSESFAKIHHTARGSLATLSWPVLGATVRRRKDQKRCNSLSLGLFLAQPFGGERTTNGVTLELCSFDMRMATPYT